MIDSKNHHIPIPQKHSWALAFFNMQLHDLKEKNILNWLNTYHALNLSLKFKFKFISKKLAKLTKLFFSILLSRSIRNHSQEKSTTFG